MVRNARLASGMEYEPVKGRRVSEDRLSIILQYR